MKKFVLALAALATTMPAMAMAQRYDHRADYNHRYDDRYEFRGYDRAGNPVYSYHDQRYNRYYRGDRYDRPCRDGTTGAVVGAIAGGLLGRTIDTRGDRTVGTVGGALAGGVAGREIDRNCR